MSAYIRGKQCTVVGFVCAHCTICESWTRLTPCTVPPLHYFQHSRPAHHHTKKMLCYHTPDTTLSTGSQAKIFMKDDSSPLLSYSHHTRPGYHVGTHATTYWTTQQYFLLLPVDYSTKLTHSAGGELSFSHTKYHILP